MGDKNQSEAPKLYDNLCNKLRPYVSLAALDGKVFSNPLDPSDAQRSLWVGVYTELIAFALIDVLDLTYKEQGEIQLRDCLLPNNLVGEIERKWHSDRMSTLISQEQVEDILRKFGEGEISDRLELPLGLYVKCTEEGYELTKNK